MVVNAPEGGLPNEDPEAGRLKIILGVDYGTTFTGELLWSRNSPAAEMAVQRASV